MTAIVTTTTLTTGLSSTLAASLSLVAVILLLILLILKEIASSSDAMWARRLSKTLNVALVPLLLVFGLIVTVRVIEVIQ